MNDEMLFYDAFETKSVAQYSSSINLYWKLVFLKDFIITKTNADNHLFIGSFEAILRAIRLVDKNEIVSAKLNMRLALDIFIKQIALLQNIPEQSGKTFGYYNDQYFKSVNNFLKNSLTDYKPKIVEFNKIKQNGQSLYSGLSDITHGRTLVKNKYEVYFNDLPETQPESQKKCIEQISIILGYSFSVADADGYLKQEIRITNKFNQYMKYFN